MIQFPNDKVYIGQTGNIKDRMSRYKSCQCKQQIKLYNALKKYSLANCLIIILTVCNDDETDTLERNYISMYNSVNDLCGYNLESGGCKYKTLSKETRDKMSKAAIARCYIPLSEDACKKISNTLKGIKRSEETRHKMSIAKKNMSEVTKNKMSIAKKGRIPWNKGLKTK